ncbi:hypothetical protein IMZ11_01100 [Microtetraspora sp. AC03309]|uniref:hypothetical protein n=1 Tax=Microtetraspora sp. AC03309 TaxID=2779376 RepID=UPI001E4BC61A|nr:hypothetical protein [Microtetraspora sp. AC03309]MCC5574237.1 hypothetical protein [Microtetraspora sp. AC03309]
MTPRVLKETLEEWAQEARVPRDLADRALRRRGRRRFAAFLAPALATGIVVLAVMLVVPWLRAAGPAPVRPAVSSSGAPLRQVIPLRPADDPPVKVTFDERSRGGVLTDTRDSPPKKMIAAGRVGVSAYWIWHPRATADGETLDRTWYLLDQVTLRYEKTDWGYLDVAPGLRYAAVLEKELPVRRIGIFHMETRRVLAWIPVDQPVAAVAWSPDGTRLVATAYAENPDRRSDDSAQCPPSDGGGTDTAGAVAGPRRWSMRTSRTGFYVVDVATATAGEFRAIDPCVVDNMNTRRDFRWSDDGTLLYERSIVQGQPDVFYDVEGNRHAAPADYLAKESKAGLSPNGRLLAGRDGLPTAVTERATGKVVGRQRVLQLLAWADDDHLVALGCAGTCRNEFNNGLVLVSVDGAKTVQLSANRKNTTKPGSWEPVFTLR